MTLQLPLRHSRTAMRGRRIGAIAIPFLLLSIAGHYLELFSTEVLLLLFVLGFFMGAAAIVMASIAVVDLWNEGGKGFSDCFFGTVYGSIVLAPLFLAALGFICFPRSVMSRRIWKNRPDSLQEIAMTNQSGRISS